MWESQDDITMKYQHALFLNPYLEKSATSIMNLFPPTGIEYVASSAQEFVSKITLLDLRYEKELGDVNKLLDFINQNIDILCVSVGWDRQYQEVCQLINRMPEHIPLVVGGYKATENVEEIFQACPNVDIIVRGEGEESIKEILQDKPLENVLGISYRTNGRVLHNPNRPLPGVDSIPPPDRRLR